MNSDPQESTLTLAWRTRQRRAEHLYLDFIVNGRSLHDLLDVSDFVGCLGWLAPEVENDYARVLLMDKPSTLGTDRAEFYVCPECADIGCGSFTCRVTQTATHLVWEAFGFENNYEPTHPDLSSCSHVGPFYFPRDAYRGVLSQRLVQL